jgi:hypothetical protein
MLFKPDLAQKTRDGLKTQTRRLKRPGDRAEYDDAGHVVAVYRNGRLLWRVGNTYAICPGRGKKAIGRFKLLHVREQRLQDVTEDDAAAEGIQRRPGLYVLDFAKLWDSINDKPGIRWKDDPDVWVLHVEPAR